MRKRGKTYGSDTAKHMLFSSQSGNIHYILPDRYNILYTLVCYRHSIEKVRIIKCIQPAYTVMYSKCSPNDIVLSASASILVEILSCDAAIKKIGLRRQIVCSSNFTDRYLISVFFDKKEGVSRLFSLRHVMQRYVPQARVGIRLKTSHARRHTQTFVFNIHSISIISPRSNF